MPGGIRRDKRDIVFSFLVRELDGNCCRVCGKSSAAVKIECAHIMSRRYRRTRWLISNAMALCNYHHRYYTENPYAWVKFVGIERYETLEKLANLGGKFTKPELEDIYQDLCRQLAQLRGEPAPTFRAPRQRKRAKRASQSRARQSRWKRKVSGEVVERGAA